MKYVINIKCSTCGATIIDGQKECDYCGNSIVIVEKQASKSNTSAVFNNVTINNISENHKALNYLGLGNRVQTFEQLKQNIDANIGDADSYFILSINMLGDKKPFELLRPKINEILENLNAAINIEEKPIYYYFRSIIKYDYFKRKHLKIEITYLDDLKRAYELGITKEDIDNFHMKFGLENIKMGGVC